MRRSNSAYEFSVMILLNCDCKLASQTDIIKQNILYVPRATVLDKPIINRYQPFLGVFDGSFHRSALSSDSLFRKINLQTVEKFCRFGVRHFGKQLFE